VFTRVTRHRSNDRPYRCKINEFREFSVSVAIVTGSAGLIGAECVRFLSEKGFQVVGIDNDMRRHFFGPEASTNPRRQALIASIDSYVHHDVDIRDESRVSSIFQEYGAEIELVINTAAQPSHDWAKRDPATDFSINATATLGLLECTRKFSPAAAFIFTSTNKVYGDNPNRLPLVELATRWELDESHPFFPFGIDESMSVDQTTHSLFGVSKLSADALVQEYGRQFDLNTVCFRGGCLTGPGHAGAELHGFLSYLVKCALTGTPYTVLGYGGKQVRDNIHSRDLVNMMWHYFQDPRPGEVYNVGGSRHSNCSILEAVQLCENRTGTNMKISFQDEHRVGDHIWYVSDIRKFQRHYPAWSYEYDLPRILDEMLDDLA